MSAPPSKRQRLDKPAFTALSCVSEAMDRLLAGQEQFSADSRLFLNILKPLQEAHITLTNLVDEQYDAVPPEAPAATPSTPLIAKFHPNLTRPFLNAFRSLDAKDFSLVQRVMDDIEAAMPKLDELVSFEFRSLRSFRVSS